MPVSHTPLTASVNWKFQTREASLRRKSSSSPGRVLANVYPGSAHVHECGLGSADDEAIWQYAKNNGFTIISKDSDFQERSVLRGYPPKVVWLRAANCTAAEIEHLLRTAGALVTRFVQQDEESCLVLGLGPMTK